MLQCVDVVTEDDGLVASLFVVLDQELGGPELVRVHNTEQKFLHRLHGQKLSVELRSHVAPHLNRVRAE